MRLTYVTEMYQREKGGKIRRFAKNAAGIVCAYRCINALTKRYVKVLMTKFVKIVCISAVTAGCALSGIISHACSAVHSDAYYEKEVFRNSNDNNEGDTADVSRAASYENEEQPDTEEPNGSGENSIPEGYYAEFYADGVLVSKIPLLNGQLAKEEPDVPERRGYTGKWEQYALAADESAIINAEYSLVYYTIEYFNVYGEEAADNPQTYTVETPEFTFNAVTRRGYVFCGWYKDEAYTQKIESIKRNSTGNLEVYANWRLEEYTIEYETEGGENPAENPGGYTMMSETITLLPAVKKNYTFIGWFVNGREISEIPTGSAGNLVLTAKWEAEEAYVCAVQDGELIDDTLNFIFGIEDTSFSVAEKIVYASGYSGKIYRKEELSEQNPLEKIEESDVLSAEDLGDGDNVFYLLVQREGSEAKRTYTLHVYKQYYVTVSYYYGKTLIRQEQALAGEAFLPYCELEDGVTLLGWKYLNGERRGEEIAAGKETVLTEDTSLCAVTE